MINLLFAMFNIYASENLMVEWGTVDSILSPRGSIRVWVKVINHDSMPKSVANESLIPNWVLTSGIDTILLSNTGYLGTFEKTLKFQPNNGLFFTDLIDLFPITGQYSTATTNAFLCLRGPKGIHYANACKAFPVGKIDNPKIENFMIKWDSIKYETDIKKIHKPDDAKRQCELMKKTWNQLSQANSLTGNLVGAAYKIRLSACGEGGKPIPYPITPAWKEFESAKSCIVGYMLQGDDNKKANAKCRTKVIDLHEFTQKLAGAQTVIPLDNGVKFISGKDTLRLYPIDYWPTQQ